MFYGDETRLVGAIQTTSPFHNVPPTPVLRNRVKRLSHLVAGPAESNTSATIWFVKAPMPSFSRHRLSGLESKLGLSAIADTGRRACANDVAPLESNDAGEIVLTENIVAVD